MPTLKDLIPDVDCKYGSPMGRLFGVYTNDSPYGFTPQSSYAITGKALLRHIPLNSGGYDRGGAYWGIGKRLYMVTVLNHPSYNFQDFYRADSREEAKTLALKAYPNITIR